MGGASLGEPTNQRTTLREPRRVEGGEGYKRVLSRARPPEERVSCDEQLMVACAVATSAVHSSSSVVGGGERRAPVASPEVSRAALLPPKASTMAFTPAASIEQLKQQLQTAIENVRQQAVFNARGFDACFCDPFKHALISNQT